MGQKRIKKDIKVSESKFMQESIQNIKNIKLKIVSILKRYEVKRAAIFGSFAKGEMRKGSDIDILVEFKGKKSLLDLV